MVIVEIFCAIVITSVTPRTACHKFLPSFDCVYYVSQDKKLCKFHPELCVEAQGHKALNVVNVRFLKIC